MFTRAVSSQNEEYVDHLVRANQAVERWTTWATFSDTDAVIPAAKDVSAPLVLNFTIKACRHLTNTGENVQPIALFICKIVFCKRKLALSNPVSVLPINPMVSKKMN